MNFNATFFGQLIAFAVFIWFCMKFVWPVLSGMIKERERHISEGLAAAEEGQRRLQEADLVLRRKHIEGRAEAALILKRAEAHGKELVARAKQQAEDEGGQLLVMAMDEIEQMKQQLCHDLQVQFATLVIEGVEQILKREVDREAHSALLDEIGARLEP